MSIGKTIIAAAFAGLTLGANAVNLTLVYVGGSSVADDIASDSAVLANHGDVLTFDLTMDFTDSDTGMLTGGFDINFDPAGLAFVSYESAGLGDAEFDRDPDVEVGRLFSGGFGSFAGLTGPALVATVSFMANGPAGTYSVGPSATDGISGPFISAFEWLPMDVDFIGTEVRIVPLPAAVWCLLSGLAVLQGLGRRRAS